MRHSERRPPLLPHLPVGRKSVRLAKAAQDCRTPRRCRVDERPTANAGCRPPATGRFIGSLRRNLTAGQSALGHHSPFSKLTAPPDEPSVPSTCRLKRTSRSPCDAPSQAANEPAGKTGRSGAGIPGSTRALACWRRRPRRRELFCAVVAASLRARPGSSLGSFRWIVWEVSPVTELNENTAFQEFHVTSGPSGVSFRSGAPPVKRFPNRTRK